MDRSHRQPGFSLDLFKRPAHNRNTMADIGKLGGGRFLNSRLNGLIWSGTWRGFRSDGWRRNCRFLDSLVFRSRQLFQTWTLLAEMDTHFFRHIVIDRAGVRFLVRNPDFQEVVEHAPVSYFKLSGQVIDANLTLHRFQVSPSSSQWVECHRV